MAVPVVQPPRSAAAAEPFRTQALEAPSRLLTAAAGSALILGSFLFLAGGREHPSIGADAGASPAEFFHAFADTVHRTGGWHSIHLLILIGPLVWAVAAPALLDGLIPRRRSGTSIARSLLLVAGTLWAVAFVIDGFGAPVYARALAVPAPGTAPDWAHTSFEALAVMMSRLGLIAWVACGLGIAVVSGLLMTRGARTPWRFAVAAPGVIIGIWPLAASLEGEYAGGPFTSSYWMLNALSVALWFAALGVCGFLRPPAVARRAATGDEVSE